MRYRTQLAIVLLAFAVMAIAIGAARPHQACAATVTPSSFCVVMRVTVTNSTGSDITDYGIEFNYPAQAAISANQLDPRALDLFAVDPGFNEIPVIAQDLTLTNARFWLQVPSIANGATVTYAIYSGVPKVLHDQGIFFESAASSSVTVSDTAALRLTSDFRVDAAFETDGTAPGSPQTIVGKYDTGASDGYRLQIIDSGGLRVRAQVDTTTVDSSGTWDGSTALWSLRLTGGDLELLKDGVLDNSTALASGTSTTQNLLIGSGVDGAVVNYVQLASAVSTTNTIEARYNFNADGVSESTFLSTGPATGTVADSSGNGLTGTYTWTWDQTNIAVVETSITLTSVEQPITFNPEVIEFFGLPFNRDISSPSARYRFMPFSQEIEDFEDAVNWPDGAVLAYFMTLIAFIVLMATAFANTNDFAMATSFAAVITLGAGLEWYAPWYPMVWAVVVFGTASARQIFR